MVERARRRRVAAGLLVAVVTMGLAACSGGSDDPAEAQSLDEQVGLDGAVVFERLAEAENFLQECMAAEGFEYVPVDPKEQEAELTGIRGLSSDEFEEQFGYGLTTLYEQQLEQAASNPNTAIRNSLPEPDRIAYDRTLNGGDPTATLRQAIDDGDFSHLGGCLREAAEKVFGGPDILSTLETELAAVEERANNDPRMVAAFEAWTECMLDKGYDYDFPEQIDQVLLERLGRDRRPARRAATPTTTATTRGAPSQQDEVATVNADIECEEEHIADVEEKVLAEYEQEFREQNADLLSEVRKP